MAMMGPMQKAIMEVKATIPKQILELAFLSNDNPRILVKRNLESVIRERVIEARVKVDCDLMGGIQVAIPLGQITPEVVDLWNVIYHIPKTFTQGRSIVSALSFSYGPGGSMGFSPAIYTAMNNMGSAGQHSPLTDALQGVYNSNAPIPIVSTAKVQLIGENVIHISDVNPIARSGYLRCMLENDEEMTNLKPASYECFSQLVIFATKAWIYNNLRIALDMGEIAMGQQLSIIKEIIDGYSDAEELYKTHLKEKWMKVSKMNDTQSWQRQLKLMSSGLR